MKRLSVLLLLLLAGCSVFGGREYALVKAAAKEGIAGAKSDRMEWNDVKLDVLTALPCDASLGAVMRLGDSRKRAILIELCGGPPADSQITIDDIAAVLNAVRWAP